jgi:hypothetical protein
MTKFYPVIVSLIIFFGGASALAPSKLPQGTKPAFDVQRAAFNGMAAASLASALVIGPMADAVEMMADTQPSFGSSSLVAERVTREGLYREYDVDLGDQQYDDARSTYKSAKETKTKKGRRYSRLLKVYYSLSHSWNAVNFLLFFIITGKYTALIAVLVVGSFIIPMAQYFWYVRDDDSSDKFFNQAKAPAPAPVPPPKKKGMFGK